MCASCPAQVFCLSSSKTLRFLTQSSRALPRRNTKCQTATYANVAANSYIYIYKQYDFLFAWETAKTKYKRASYPTAGRDRVSLYNLIKVPSDERHFGTSGSRIIPQTPRYRDDINQSKQTMCHYYIVRHMPHYCSTSCAPLKPIIYLSRIHM